MGDSVLIFANITQDAGTVATVWPYVNSFQWGSGASLSATETFGTVSIILPLPFPSDATSIQLASLAPNTTFLVGQPVPAGAVLSNVVTVQVTKRAIPKQPPAPSRFGMEWEPWFMPLNAVWDLSEATPLVGRYNSCDPGVIRQHAIWFAQMGIDFLLVDWTNNIWNTPHWSDRSPGVNYLIEGFLCLLDNYVALQAEGLVPVPQVLLLLGLDNGPQATMQCLNEEIWYIYSNLTSNPKYNGLWQELDGKPLLIPFDGGAMHNQMGPIDDRFFTIRWMMSQMQGTNYGAQGYWSWMDGDIAPPAVIHNGSAEALTITNAFFAGGGWLRPTARGQDGGSTLMEEFKQAVKVKPQFLNLCQWNEFIGQPAGQGYGPNHDIYVDIFNVTFSNDMEPTSLQQIGYRSTRGGWGFYYVNQVRALRDLYIQVLAGPGPLADEPIVLASIAAPDRQQNITQKALVMQWSVIGPYDGTNNTYAIQVNDVTVAKGITEQTYTLNLAGVQNGPATITVIVENRTTRYPLSADRVDAVPLENPIPLQVSVEVNIALN